MRNPLQNISGVSKEFLIYFLLMLVSFYFAYSSAINIPFYHHDIYQFSFGGFHQSCRRSPGFPGLINLGRPFSAYLECINNKIGNTLGGISELRWFSLVLISATASCFALSLRALKISFWEAFFVSVSIFLLGAIMTVVIMVANNLMVALLLTFAANYLIAMSASLYTNDADRQKAILFFGTGFVCVIISFLTYPAMTAFFLMPAFLAVLFKPLSSWSETRKIVIRDVLVYSVGCVLFFVGVKLFEMHHRGTAPAGYQFNANFHFLDRFVFLYKAMPSLWNLDAGFKQALLIKVFLIAGCLAGLRNFYKNADRSPRILLQAIAAVLVLLVFANSVYLGAPDQGTPFSRVIFVFQAMVILLLFWSAIQFSRSFFGNSQRFIFAAAAALLLAGVYYANYIVTLSALNDYAELNFITTSIAQRVTKDKNPLKRIHIIPASVINFNGLSNHEDIFNINSTFYVGEMTNIVNAAMLRIALRHSFEMKDCIFSGTNEENYLDKEAKCIDSLHQEDIAVTYSMPGKPIYFSPDLLIINMDDMAPIVKPKLKLSEILGSPTHQAG